MRDYSETESRLRFMAEKSKALNMLTGWDDGGVTALYTDAADVRPVGKWVKNHHPKCIFSELIWIGGYRFEVEACEAWNWRYDYV